MASEAFVDIRAKVNDYITLSNGDKLTEEYVRNNLIGQRLNIIDGLTTVERWMTTDANRYHLRDTLPLLSSLYQFIVDSATIIHAISSPNGVENSEILAFEAPPPAEDDAVGDGDSNGDIATVPTVPAHSTSPPKCPKTISQNDSLGDQLESFMTILRLLTEIFFHYVSGPVTSTDPSNPLGTSDSDTMSRRRYFLSCVPSFALYNAAKLCVSLNLGLSNTDHFHTMIALQYIVSQTGNTIVRKATTSAGVVIDEEPSKLYKSDSKSAPEPGICWIAISRLGVEAVESPEVQCAAMSAVGALLQRRVCKGKSVEVIDISNELLMCLSYVIDANDSIVNPVVQPDASQLAKMKADASKLPTQLSGQHSKFVLLMILKLLTDPDHNEKSSDSVSNKLSDHVTARFAKQEYFVAFQILNAVFLAKKSTFVYLVMLGNGIALQSASDIVLGDLFVDSLASRAASEFLLNCLDCKELRALVAASDNISRLFTVFSTASDDTRVIILSILSRLCSNSADDREFIFNQLDFNTVTAVLANLAESTTKKLQAFKEEKEAMKKGVKNFFVEQRERFRVEDQHMINMQRILQILTAFAPHSVYKLDLMGLSEDTLHQYERTLSDDYAASVVQRADKANIALEKTEAGEIITPPDLDVLRVGDNGSLYYPVVAPGTPLADRIQSMKFEPQHTRLFSSVGLLMKNIFFTAANDQTQMITVDSLLILYAQLCYQLVTSKYDRQMIDETDGFNFDESQVEQLRQMYDKLPAESKPAMDNDFDYGGLLLTMAVRCQIVQPLLVSVWPFILKNVDLNRQPTLPKLVGLVTSRVASVVTSRLDLLKCDSLNILLNCLRSVKSNTTVKTATLNKANLRRNPYVDEFGLTIALLTLSANVAGLTYTQLSSITYCLLDVLKAQYNLNVRMGAMALVNITSYDEASCMLVMDHFSHILTTVTEVDDLTSSFLMEIVCNCSARSQCQKAAVADVVTYAANQMEVKKAAEEKRNPVLKSHRDLIDVNMLLACAADITNKPRCLAAWAALAGFTSEVLLGFHWLTTPLMRIVDGVTKTEMFFDRLCEIVSLASDDEGIAIRLGVLLSHIWIATVFGMVQKGEQYKNFAIQCSCAMVLASQYPGVVNGYAQLAGCTFSDEMESAIQKLMTHVPDQISSFFIQLGVAKKA